jgi:DNA-binding LacI/PurR family transcriptional regulator
MLVKIYEDMEVQSKDVFITIEETDLVNLVHQIREKGLKMGKDLGVISYNDTPLKELLGITVISTNFKAMGKTAADFLRRNKNEKVKDQA